MAGVFSKKSNIFARPRSSENVVNISFFQIKIFLFSKIFGRFAPFAKGTEFFQLQMRKKIILLKKHYLSFMNKMVKREEK